MTGSKSTYRLWNRATTGSTGPQASPVTKGFDLHHHHHNNAAAEEDNNNNTISVKFLTSIAEFMQSLCNKNLQFAQSTLVTGQLYLSFDNGEKTEFVINEKVCSGTSEERDFMFLSNSFDTVKKNTQTQKQSKQDSEEGVVQEDSVSSKIQASKSKENKAASGKGKKEQKQKRAYVKRGPNPDSYQCGFCPEVFKERFDMIEHQRIHPLECRYCEKDFSNYSHSYLLVHERTHTNEKPFVCEQCGKGFTQAGNLATHRRSHSDEKKYKCVTCGNFYKSKHALKRHLKNHTGERPAVCHICAKSFTDAAYLKKHMVSHFGQKRFVCNICGEKFTKTDLRLHKQFKHPNQPDPPRIRKKKPPTKTDSENDDEGEEQEQQKWIDHDRQYLENVNAGPIIKQVLAQEHNSVQEKLEEEKLVDPTQESQYPFQSQFAARFLENQDSRLPRQEAEPPSVQNDQCNIVNEHPSTPNSEYGRHVEDIDVDSHFDVVH